MLCYWIGLDRRAYKIIILHLFTYLVEKTQHLKFCPGTKKMHIFQQWALLRSIPIENGTTVLFTRKKFRHEKCLYQRSEIDSAATVQWMADLTFTRLTPEKHQKLWKIEKIEFRFIFWNPNWDQSHCLWKSLRRCMDWLISYKKWTADFTEYQELQIGLEILKDTNLRPSHKMFNYSRLSRAKSLNVLLSNIHLVKVYKNLFKEDLIFATFPIDRE